MLSNNMSYKFVVRGGRVLLNTRVYIPIPSRKDMSKCSECQSENTQENASRNFVEDCGGWVENVVFHCQDCDFVEMTGPRW